MNRQFLSILSLAFAAAAAISCSQAEMDDPKGDAGKTVTIGVDIPTTKTHLGEADPAGQYKVYWSAGDVIAVNNIPSDALAEEAAGQSSAMFTVTGTTAPYSIVYPASICSAASGTSLTVNLPDAQDYTAGTFAEESNVLYGYSQDGNGVALNHLTGILKLGLKAKEGALTDRVKRVEVISNSDTAPIAGTFTLDVLTGEMTALEGDGMITLNVVSGKNKYVTLSSENYTFFHIAVPAGEYREGFTVKVYDYSNSLMTGTWKPENQDGDGVLAPGAMKNIKAELVPARRTISTQADLEDFITAANANTPQYGAFVNPETGAVELANDIVCEGTTDLPRMTKAWKGTFDGKGFAIKKSATKIRPLFTTIAENGVVRNLTVEGDATDIFSWGTLAPWWSTLNVRPYAMAMKNYGLMENCTSKVDISLNGVNTDFYIAGICLHNAGTLSGCVNEGNITIDASLASDGKQCQVAGIAISSTDGWMHPEDSDPDSDPAEDPSEDSAVPMYITAEGGQFNNCRNSGNLTVYKNGTATLKFLNLEMAGIVANVKGGTSGKYTQLINCDNSGDILYAEPTYSKAANSPKAIGGIVACVGKHYSGDTETVIMDAAQTFADSGYPALLQYCDNTGDLSMGCVATQNLTMSSIALCKKSQAFVGGIVGYAHGQDSENVVEIKNCTNQCAFTVASRNYNGHIVGGIVAGATYVSIESCTAKQTLDDYTAIVSSTAKLQIGCFGGIAGATYDNLSISDSKSFCEICYCYEKAYPAIKGTGTNGELKASDIGSDAAPTRANSLKGCGFLVAGCAAGKTVTATGCAVGGTADFYRYATDTSSRYAVVLSSESDMTTTDNAVCDYYMMSNGMLSGTVTYWDGTIPTPEQ